MFFFWQLSESFSFPYRIYPFCIVFKFHSAYPFSQSLMLFMDRLTLKLFKILLWIEHNSNYTGIANIFNRKVIKLFFFTCSFLSPYSPKIYVRYRICTKHYFNYFFKQISKHRCTAFWFTNKNKKYTNAVRVCQVDYGKILSIM